MSLTVHVERNNPNSREREMCVCRYCNGLLYTDSPGSVKVWLTQATGETLPENTGYSVTLPPLRFLRRHRRHLKSALNCELFQVEGRVIFPSVLLWCVVIPYTTIATSVRALSEK